MRVNTNALGSRHHDVGSTPSALPSCFPC